MSKNEKFVTDMQIESEAKSVFRPDVIDAGLVCLPFSQLGDREFELLVYLLLKEEISAGAHDNISKIALMQGVGERGRDCVLFDKDVVCGLVQCKKHSNKITKPMVLKEIIKFLLYSMTDNKIMPTPESFHYTMYVSSDLCEPAINLMSSFKSEIEDEISNGNIRTYALQVAEEYESFFAFRERLPVDNLVSKLRRISVSYSNATDITARLHSYGNILKCFFRAPSVLDDQYENMLRRVLAESNVKYITDNDLKIFQKRVGDTPSCQRINFGLVDLYGYSLDFFRWMDDSQKLDVLRTIAEGKAYLDMKLMDYVCSQISEQIFQEITIKLLATQMIHRFSVGVAGPYLTLRILPLVAFSEFPIEIANSIVVHMSKDQAIDYVAEQLFDTSAKAFANDFSTFSGTPDLIDLKKKILAHSHDGIHSVDELRAVFAKDRIVLMPVLDAIEAHLKSLCSHSRTVVVKGASFFSDNEQLEMVMQTISSLDKK
jgi:hypothetical protein